MALDACLSLCKGENFDPWPSYLAEKLKLNFFGYVFGSIDLFKLRCTCREFWVSQLFVLFSHCQFPSTATMKSINPSYPPPLWCCISKCNMQHCILVENVYHENSSNVTKCNTLGILGHDLISFLVWIYWIMQYASLSLCTRPRLWMGDLKC